ncbi:hypothetical protein BaRGS_00027451 [Batillaria attramentaria]|uniref:RETREG1-3/ARL6IP-like N-terminal reticulon-homology domain-containing protein n=1 Tax=Batillaria attramentaria TaxID=370345 RepID=A0ABD0K1J6_9CAEN
MNEPQIGTATALRNQRRMGDADKHYIHRSKMEAKLNELLNPIEPLVMRLQSLLVWEYPRKSAVMLLFAHLVFWIVSRCCVQVYSLVSVSLMVIFFVDTWKKKIWPEIRVPPPVPEDTDGWTPVHPRLLSVPEISRHLAAAFCFVIKLFGSIRNLRREKPFVFFLFFSVMFISTAALGQYMSGFMIVYTIVMSVMIWPSLVYHNLLKRAYLRMEPAFMWLDYQMKSKCRIRRAQPVELPADVLVGGKSGGDGRTGLLPQVVEVVEEEDFEPSMDPATTAALARAITDSEDEGTGGTPSIPTPGLSKEPSIDNSDEERRTDDFNLDVDDMPSFDDLDHSDDELTPVTRKLPKSLGVRSGLSLSAGDISFSPSHFDDSDSDEESASASGSGLSFPDVAQTVLSSDTDASTANLTSALVTKTLSSMMETALQGVMGMTGVEATSSGRIPHTGTKITYTKTPEGESIDFATPEPTITEDDEGCEPSDDENSNALDDTINNEVAEIEKDFDFLDELDESESRNK